MMPGFTPLGGRPLDALGRRSGVLLDAPDGTHRWHFTKPPNADEDDLDKELAEFDA
jgi:hypothetical protein